MKHYILLFTLVLALVLGSCRKTVQFTGSNVTLEFSQDTIYVDTVFTGLGSSTRTLKVFNRSNENVTVDKVYLARGQESFYSLNIDGISGHESDNIEILAKDSAYLFIKVSPDAAGQDELVYTDSIFFENGSVRQHVNLITAVWDAYYHFPTNVLTIERPSPLPPLKLAYSILSDNEVWDASKPHVVYGYAVVDSARTLTIEPGTKVHVHDASGLWIYRDGNLFIDKDLQGDFSNPVVFQGDRLEPEYEWVPGQWGGLLGGIFIMGGDQGHSIINNTLIKNATNALRIDSSWKSTPNIELHNVILTHNSRVSLYAGFANIKATNLAIGPSGVYGFYALGGTYLFDHCTFYNTWGFSSRGGTSVGMMNFYEDALGMRYTRPISALYTNSLISGTLPNEVAMGIDPNDNFLVNFKSCALRIEPNPELGHYDLSDSLMFDDTMFNLNWGFSPSTLIPADQWQFKPDSISTLFAKSNPTNISPMLDLEGTLRSQSATIGALERK